MAFKFLHNIFPLTHTDAIYQLKQFMKDTTSGPGWTVTASGTGVYDSSPASYIHWKLDESSGNLFRNSGALGENNLITDSYQVVSGVESLSGKGVKLNGVSGSYLSTAAQTVNPEKKFTVSFLVRVHGVKASSLLVRGTNAATDVSFEILDTSGNWKVSYTVGGTAKDITVNGSTDPKIIANQDYLMSFTYAAATSGTGYVATAYLNAIVSGSSVAFSKQNAETAAFSWLTGAKWVVGNNFAGSNPSNATFSDIRVENLPRDASYLSFVYSLHANSHLNWKLNEQLGLGKLSSNGSSGEYTLSSNLDAPEYYNAGHTATKLSNNKVLIVGGSTTSAYLLDPVDGIFSKTGSTSTTRSWHTATALKDGYVLLVGGESDGAFGDGAHATATNTAELYDPTSGTFVAVSNMANSRSRHTATLITSGSYDGYVLIAGGLSSSSNDAACELYNPATRSFISAGSMKAARSSHSATTVNGKILLAGGVYGGATLSSTEIFDFSTGAFVSGSTPSLSSARANHTATLLTDNSVLFFGGEAIVGAQLANVSSVESCDSSLTAFTTVTDSGSSPLSLPRSYHSSVLLSDGNVLITGGVAQDSSHGSTVSNYTKDSFIYNPSAKTFSAVSMIAPRANHQSMLLQDKNVLVVGGAQNGSNSEVYDAVSQSFRASNAFIATASPGIIGNTTNLAPVQNTKIYLPFNSDTNFSDISSNGVTITSNNVTLSSDVSKSSGRSCYFNGTSSYLSFTPGFSLANVGWTIDAWVYPQDISSSFQTIVSRSSNANLDWAIQISSSQIRFRTNNDDSSIIWANASNSNLTANYQFSSNTWYRIVAVHDGSSLSLFVNDISKAIANQTLAVTAAGGTTAKACVGCMNFDAPKDYFKGYIDNLRISVANKAAIVNIAPNKIFYSYSNPDLNTALLVRFNNQVYSGKVNVTKDWNNLRAYTTNTYTNINWKMEEGLNDDISQRVIGYANVLKNNVSGANPWVKEDSDLVAKEFIPAVRNTLAYARHSFSATLLANGKILIAGGNDGTGAISNASLYDPLTKTFSATGSLNAARQNHTATLLANGKVLVVGGKSASSLSSAEIFDPITNTFTASSSTLPARNSHSACLLNDGYVLVVGGFNGTSSLNDGYLYDPNADAFTSAGTFTGARYSATATKLANGKVLICGGSNTAGTSVNTTTIYDRSSGFSAGPTMVSARSSHTATLLPSGKVLLAGGVDASSNALATTELFDSSAAGGAGSFTAGTSLTSARSSHTAALLTDGYVVLAGGLSGSTYLATSQAYSSTNNTVGAEVTMASARANASCVSLVDSNLEGKAIIIGGQSSASAAVDTAEIFAISSGVLSVSTSTSSLNMGASILLEDPEVNKLNIGSNSGKVLVTGGSNGNVVTNSTQILDPDAATFVAGPTMANKRVGHFAVEMSDNKILVGGGWDGVSSYQTSAEVYDPSANNLKAAPSTTSPRYLSAAALMNGGKVMVSGGKTDSSVLNTVEVYNTGSVTGSSSLTPIDSNTNIEWKFDDDSNPQFFADDGYGKQGATLYGRDFPIFANDKMQSTRYGATYTALANGKILITGGRSGSDYNTGTVLNTADIYDPYSGIISPVGNMNYARSRHKAALMSDGRVLILGGVSGSASTSAEIYDPSSSAFYVTGSMITARINEFAAVTMSDGRVLVAGGNSGSYVSAAEIYDPSTGTFTATGSLNTARDSFNATLLSNGKVLCAGGYNGSSLTTCEIYDPSAGTFSTVSISARHHAQVTTLQDGRVLISGGYNGASLLNTAQIYNPQDNTVSSSITMQVARALHSSVTLSDGTVLLSGGYSAVSTAEIFNPSNSQFSTTTGSMNVGRYYHASFLMPNGKVVIVGGSSTATNVETYDSSTKTFSSLGNAKLQSTTCVFGAALLNDGKVVIAGGCPGSGTTKANVFDPSTNSFKYIADLNLVRYDTQNQAITLANGKVLFAGYASGYDARTELFDPSTNTFSYTTGSMPSPSYGSVSVLLANGDVMTAGGTPGSGVLASAKVYSASLGTWSNASNSMSDTKLDFTSTLLDNGKVLVVGGTGDGGAVRTSCDLYDQSSKTFTATGSLTTGRFAHTATKLSNGKVLIVGGFNGGSSHDGVAYSSSSTTATCELYDPSSGTFSAVGSLQKSRGHHTANLLSDGRVLITGGFDGTNYLSSTEIYDPSTNTFSYGPSLSLTRRNHRAITLSNNKILIVGGRTASGVYTDTAEFVNVGAASISSIIPTSSSNKYKFGLQISVENPEVASVNGKVIVTGGTNSGNYLSSLNVYDPVTGDIVSGSTMSSAREGHILQPLPNNKALIAGGTSNGTAYLNTAQIYDTSSNSFTDSDFMTSARYKAKSTVLSDNKVLITGGYASFGSDPLATAEVYSAKATSGSNNLPAIDGYTEINLKLEESVSSPQLANSNGSSSVTSALTNDFPVFAGNTFSSVTSSTYPYLAVSVTLSNGNVLILGGAPQGGIGTKSADIFDAKTGTVYKISDMTTARSYFRGGGAQDTSRSSFTATLLNDGRVLIAGGDTGSSSISSAEIFDPATCTFYATGSMVSARANHTATLLKNGKVLICGGYDSSLSSLSSAELYDPSTNTFSNTGSMTTARYNHESVLLSNGKVLVMGGRTTASCDIFDPSGSNGSGSFSFAGNMTTSRGGHSAALISGSAYDGYVFIAGGWNGGYLSSTELYNPGAPTASAFTSGPSLTSALYSSSSVMLNNGKIIVINGDQNGSGGVNTSITNLYDPATKTITAGPNTNVARRKSYCSVISGGAYDGYVIIVGQSSYPELYNPSSNSFLYSSSTNLTNYKFGSFAGTYNIQQAETTKLSDGRVLVTGGTNGTVQSANAIYNPSTGTFTTSGVPALTSGKINHFVSPTTSGKYLIAGGNNGATYYNTAQIYTESAGAVGSIAATTRNMNESRTMAKASKIKLNSSDGYVLVTGGHAGSGASSTAEIYNPNTNTFSYSTKSNSATYSLETTTIDSNTLYNWKLNDASGASSFVNSASGSGSAISLSKGGTTANITSGVTGIDGNCVSFSGASNSWLYSANTLVNTGPASLTMSCWVKLSSYSAYAPIFYKSYAASTWNSPYASFGFFQSSAAAGNWLTRMTINGSAVDRTITVNTIPLNTWTLLSATYDGTTMKTYLNGLLVDTYVIAGSISYLEASPYVIGGSHATTYYTTGSIDDVRVDNTVRSANYIRSLYIGAANTVSSTGGSMSSSRHSHTSTALSDGKVLIVGGATHATVSSSAPTASNGFVLPTAEIYDPSTGLFQLTSGDLSMPRYNHTATLLPSGKVLITGGQSLTTAGNIANAELYDPSTKTFTTVSRAQADSSVMVSTDSSTRINWKLDESAGSTTFSNSISSSVLNLSAYGNVSAGLSGISGNAVLFPGAGLGDYLATQATTNVPPITGFTISMWVYLNGYNSNYANIITKSYDSTGTWQSPNWGPICIFMPPSSGTIRFRYMGVYEQTTSYSIPTNSWTLITFTYDGSTFKLYANGDVKLTSSLSFNWGNGGIWYVGGHKDTVCSISGLIDDVRIEDTVRSADYITSMYLKGMQALPPAGRSYATANLLPNNKNIVIVGGQNGSSALSSVEIFDVYSQKFSNISVPNATYNHRAELSSTGDLVVIGGYSGSAYTPVQLLNSSEIRQYSDGVDAKASLVKKLTSISTTDTNKPSTTNGFTMSVWVKLNSYTQNGLILGKKSSPTSSETDPTGSGYSALLKLTSGGSWQYLGSQGAKSVSGSSAPLALNSWNLISVTNDGYNTTVYKNGSLVATVPENLTTSNALGTGAWSLGSNASSAFYGIDGYLDDLRIETKARSAAEIAALYAGAGGFTPTINSMSAGKVGHSSTLLKNGKVLVAGGAKPNTNFLDWNLDESSAPFASKGTSSLNLTVSGSGITAGQSGVNSSSSAVSFSGGGSGTCLTSGNTSIQPTGNFTISVWVYLTQYSQYGAIFVKNYHASTWGSAFASVGLYQADASTGKLRCHNNSTYTDTTYSLPLNTWTLISATFDGSYLKYYANGVQINSFTTSSINWGENGSWNFGGGMYAISAIYGKVDNVTVENVCRSSSELQSIYASGSISSPKYTYASADLYDPATRTFAATGNLNIGRYNHSASLINGGAYDGYVLIAGGQSSTVSGDINTPELYNPTSGTFSSISTLKSTDSYTQINWKLDDSTTPFLNSGYLGSYSSALSTKVGTVTSGASGINGSAVSFSSSSYLATSLSPYYPTGNFTVSMWVYLNSYTTYGNLIVKDDGGGWSGTAFGMYLGPSNNGSIRCQANATIFNVDSAIGTIPLSTWTLLSITYDGSSVTYYANGKSIAVITPTSLSSLNLSASGAWYIGGYFTTIGSIDGKINDVRIESTARSAQYLYELYMSGVGFMRSEHSAITLPNNNILLSGGKSSSTARSDAMIYESQVGEIRPVSMGYSTYRHRTALSSTGDVVVVGGTDGAATPTYRPIQILNSSESRIHATGTNGNAASSSTFSSLYTKDTWVAPKSNSCTISLWVNLRTYTPNAILIAKKATSSTVESDPTGSGYAFMLKLTNDGYWQYSSDQGLYGTTISSVSNKIALNTPTLISVTNNGTSTTIYKNGVSVATVTQPAINFGYGAWSVGSNASNSLYNIDGYIDDVRIENTARSASQLLSLYGTPSTATDPYTIINWKLEETQGANLMADSGTNSGLRLTSSDSTVFPSASLFDARARCRSVTLSNGDILIVGGNSNTSAYLSSAEIFSPKTNTTYKLTSKLNYARVGHEVILLNDGRVLIVGGSNGGGNVLQCETFDPATKTFSVSASLSTGRYGRHSLVKLSNGKVLIMCGMKNSSYSPTNAVESFDPSTNTITSVGTTLSLRTNQVAALLDNGNVLIAGGYNGSYLSSAEIYNTTSNSSSSTGSMSSARERAAIAKLSNGDILVAGGFNGSSDLNTAEYYVQSSATFTTVTSTMSAALSNAQASLLSSGKVFISGGQGPDTSYVYDHSSKSFTLTSNSMTYQRTSGQPTTTYYNIVSTSDGNLFFAGSFNGSSYSSGIELFVPSGSSGSFSAISPSFNFGTAITRENPEISKLNDGRVFVTGGTSSAGYLSTTELYDPSAGTTSAGPALPSSSARRDHFSAKLTNGNVLVGGGYNGTSYLNSAYVYTPASGAAGSFGSAINMNTTRALARAVTLNNGNVLVTGGHNGGNSLQTAEIYSGSSFGSNINMVASRHSHTITKLNDGYVLITGGATSAAGSTSLSSAEIFDPSTNTFTAVGSLNKARYNHTATLLSDGTVLIAGGQSSTTAGNVTDAEIYNPITKKFTYAANLSSSINTAKLNTGRSFAQATLLPNKNVLISGGKNSSTTLATSEIYDFYKKTFTTVSMVNSTTNHRAVLSDAGDVVLIGGTDGSTTYRPVQLFNSSQTAQKLTGPDNFAISTKGITSLSSDNTSIAPQSNQFTISFFVNLSSYSSNGIFVAKKYSPTSAEYNASGSGYAIAIKQKSSNNGSWQITANNGAVTLDSGSNIALNAITHVAVTNGANGLKIYLNGAVVATGSRLTVDFGSGPWSVGSNASSDFFASNALIDEVRIESTERDATYILGLCNSRAGFILLSSTMTTSRWGHTITALPTVTEPNLGNLYWQSYDNMLIIGGATNTAGTTATDSIDIYDPRNVGNYFTLSGKLSAPRYNHAAIMVSGYQYSTDYDGSVIVVGGKNPGATPLYPTAVEACHPRFTGCSKVVGNIQIGREKPSVILLPNGNLLITGGYNASGPVSTAEIFDIYSGTSSLVNMPYPTQKHRSVLTNGKNVVVIGGKKDDNVIASSYLKTQLLNASSIRSRVNGIYTRSEPATGNLNGWYAYDAWLANQSAYANKVNKLTVMSTPNNPTKTPSSNKFTVSVWVYLNSYTSNALIVGKKTSSSSSEYDPSGAGYSFALKQTVGGAWQVVARNSSGAVSITPYSDKKIPLNTWTLLSVTNNGMFTRTYMNGVPASLPTTQSSVDFGTGPWSVGSNASNNAYAMDGYIDDIRIEDITRTSAYLRNLYQSTTSPSSSITNLFEDASLYARDIVPRGANGSVTSTPTINRGTNLGTSVSGGYSGVFNGTDGYLEFIPNFNLSNKPWTMETWVYSRSSGPSTIISCGSSWNLNVSSSSISFVSGPNSLTANTTISTNTWHHLAATHDGSTLKLFVDGYMAASGSFVVQSGGDTNQATIGCKNDGALSQFFDGYMEDLRIITDRCLYKSSFSVGGDGVVGNKVTLSCWIYPRDFGTSESGIVYKLLDNNSWSSSPSPSIAMGMSLSSSGIVNHYITVDGITQKNAVSGIRLNRWSLLTMTFDGSTSTFTSYLNDAKATSQVVQSKDYYEQTIAASGNIDWGNHGSWYVGSFPQQNSSFNGNISDVRLENTSRTLSDVSSLYAHTANDMFGTSGTTDLIASKEDLKKYSWFVLKSNSTSAPRYLCFQRGETLDKWRVKYSTSAFSGSFSYDTTPSPASSSDEANIRGGGTNAIPTFGKLFGGLTEGQYVLHAGAGYSSDSNKFFFFGYSKGDVASQSPAKTMFIMDSLPDFSGSQPILGRYPTSDQDTTVIGVLNNFSPSYNHIKYSNYSSDYSANNFDRIKGFVSKNVTSKQALVNIAISSWGPIIKYNGADGYDGYAWSPSQSSVKNPHTQKFGLMPANYFYKNAVATSDTNQSYKGSSSMVYTAATDSSVKNWDRFTIDSVADKIVVNGFVLPWDNANTQDS